MKRELRPQSADPYVKVLITWPIRPYDTCRAAYVFFIVFRWKSQPFHNWRKRGPLILLSRWFLSTLFSEYVGVPLNWWNVFSIAPRGSWILLTSRVAAMSLRIAPQQHCADDFIYFLEIAILLWDFGVRHNPRGHVQNETQSYHFILIILTVIKYTINISFLMIYIYTLLYYVCT